MLIFGCSRYDYYPSGIKHADQKRPISSNRSAYIVQYGDTLYSIGRKLGIDFHRLARFNRIRRPYTIFVGQRLYTHASAKKQQPRHTKKHHPKTTKKPKHKQKKHASKHKTKHKTKHKKYPKASGSRVKLRWPVQGRLSSKFGPRKNRMHDGIDIAAKAGTHVFAAAAGKVVYADSRLSGYGNLIIIRHSSDMFTAYAHNQKNLVVVGQHVKAGQHISNVGSSGRATGPHLHFEVRRGETAVDPLAYLPKK
ncbi:MAG: M23 family metallopeptidase [Ghiorsea sp.]|nr:M23 family metallopeptidase [Ghiorsea sp.]